MQTLPVPRDEEPRARQLYAASVLRKALTADIDIDACPVGSWLPQHYRADGSCRCNPDFTPYRKVEIDRWTHLVRLPQKRDRSWEVAVCGAMIPAPAPDGDALPLCPTCRYAALDYEAPGE